MPGLSDVAGAVVCLTGVDLTGVKVENDMALVAICQLFVGGLGR